MKKKPLKVGDRVETQYGKKGTVTALRQRYSSPGCEYLAWERGCMVLIDGTSDPTWEFIERMTVINPSPSFVRSFPSGATRDTDAGKIDFEGFLSPLALEAFGKYMQKHQTMSDGSTRASDNWQKGFGLDVLMKSTWRHFFAVWRGHRGTGISVDDLCALMFNVQGLLHEILKGKETGK